MSRSRKPIGLRTPPAARSVYGGAFGGQRDGVTFGIGHVGNALAPEHVFGLSQDWGAGGLEFFDALVDIVDVDEQLEARILADLEADELSG